MLKLVISGAQSGADVAALQAAVKMNIPTGGWMPKGFKTLDGNRPQYANMYRVKEMTTPSYKERTWANVEMADATLRFAFDFSSSGEKCTLSAIKEYNKPYMDVILTKNKIMEFDIKRNGMPVYFTGTHPDTVGEWLIKQNVEILNVAGNSQKTAPGIEEFVRVYLLKVFTKIGAEEFLGSL